MSAACLSDHASAARLWAYADALNEVLSAAPRGDTECLPVSEALGRVLSESLSAPEALPPFDNAAMDGYALCLDADAAAGAMFEIVGEQAAGDLARDAGAFGTEIMTGAHLPNGLNSVVPIEHTELLGEQDGRRRIRLLQPVALNQHVRCLGEDVNMGDVLLPQGSRLGTEQLTLAAALGIARCKVARRPSIALLSTGRELVDDASVQLNSGQIRNSNRPYLAMRISEAGARLSHAETVEDSIDRFLAALDRALQSGADMVVSTGAVSMGRYDFVPEALARRDAEIRFHKCKMRPGKPILFALLPGGRLYFGLPGNPISSAVGFRFFVEPAIRQWLGLPPERGTRVPLLNDLKGKPPLRMHLKGRLELIPEGQLGAHILNGQESFRLRPLLQTNAWLVVEDDQPAPRAGELITAYSASHLLPLAFSGVGD